MFFRGEAFSVEEKRFLERRSVFSDTEACFRGDTFSREEMRFQEGSCVFYRGGRRLLGRRGVF